VSDSFRAAVVHAATGYVGRGVSCCADVAPAYDPKRTEWCGWFVLKCWRDVGLTTKTWGQIMRHGAIAGWLPTTRSPLPGDMAYVHKPNQHMAVVTKVEGNTIYTADGNSTGGVVCTWKRDRHEFTCFYRMPIPSAVSFSPGKIAPVKAPCESVRDVWLAYSEPLESRVSWMYLDVFGYVTTGVGNLIDTVEQAQRLPWTLDGTVATPAEIGYEWHRVKAKAPGQIAANYRGRLRLSDTAIDAMVWRQFDLNVRMLVGRFPDFAAWPADAQLGIMSLAWAVGAGLTEWPKFCAACTGRDWRTAATESVINSTRNKGVIPRNNAQRRLFDNAAAVESAIVPLDPTVVWWPMSIGVRHE